MRSGVVTIRTGWPGCPGWPPVRRVLGGRRLFGVGLARPSDDGGLLLSFFSPHAVNVWPRGEVQTRQYPVDQSDPSFVVAVSLPLISPNV